MSDPGKAILLESESFRLPRCTWKRRSEFMKKTGFPKNVWRLATPQHCLSQAVYLSLVTEGFLLEAIFLLGVSFVTFEKWVLREKAS